METYTCFMKKIGGKSLIFPLRDNQQRRTITVTGTGDVQARPDFAQIQIGVVTESLNASEASRENASLMNRVIQSLVNLGIQRADIQTAQYNVFPKYDYVEGRQEFRGYEVTNSVSVKIRNIQDVSNVIDTAVSNGANRVSQIEFKIENVNGFVSRALQLALQNAGEKAVAIAEKLRLSYMPVPIEITEERLNEPILFREMAASRDIGTPIEPGIIEIRAELKVKYQY